MAKHEDSQQLQLWCFAWKVKSDMGKDWKTRQARRGGYWSCICTSCKFSCCKEESDAQLRYQRDNHANNLILQTVFLVYPFRLLWAAYNSLCLSLRAVLRPLQSAVHGPTPFNILEVLPLLYPFCTVHTQILNELDLTSEQQCYIKWLFSNS